MAGVIRGVRQICLLREQGRADEATRVEQNEFANAVRDLRLAQGADKLPESELRNLFVAEERRVADAAILSALLIPQLVKSFSASPFNSSSSPPVNSSPPFPVAARSLDSSSETIFPRESSVPFARSPATVPAGAPVIADLLDAMLASERGARGPASSKR